MASKAEIVAPAAAHRGPQRIRLSQSIVAGITALSDLILIVGTGLLIFTLYVAPSEPERLAAYLGATAIMGFFTAQSFYLGGLYRFTSLIHPAESLLRIMTLLPVVFMFLLGCAFALKTSDQFSRVWAFSWLAVMMLLVPLARFGIAGMVQRWAKKGYLGRNIIVYGAGEQGSALIRHIQAVNEPWNRIVGVFDERASRGAADLMGFPVLGDMQSLVTWARKNRADEVLIALPWGAEERVLEIIRNLSVLPTNIRLTPEFVGTDLLHRRTSFQYGVPMLSVLDKPVSGWAALFKSILDYVLGSIFLIIGLPIMALIAAAIKLESKGPVLFRQKRCGFNDQLIDVFKFRTMYVEQTDHDGEQLTRINDPRVTRVGAILRRFSLDELPQLFNVMRGEMSVVGPRPHALRAKAGDTLYEDVIDQYAVRHKVKPGITGWAQVNGWRGPTSTEADLLGRLEHDLYYIENWSILFDLLIIVRTFFAVAGGENSH